MSQTVDAVAGAAERPLATLSSGLAGFTQALLRIGTALLFMEHGMMKLFGWFQPDQPPPPQVHLLSMMGVAGVLETFGGLLIVLGLGVRPVAALLCGEMIVAYATVHSHMGTWPIVNHGELALLYLSIFAFLAGNGAGPFSLDALIFKRRR